MTEAPPTLDEVASLGQRALARSVDLLIVAVISLAFFARQLAVRSEETVPRWTQVAVFLVWLAYEAGTTAFLGRTIGKLAAGCQVVERRSGEQPGIARSVIRSAVVPGLLPLLNVFGLLAYATAAADRREYRGLLDRLAGTAVIKARSPLPGRDQSADEGEGR